MRVKSRIRRDERGAVLIIVSVFAVVSLIFLAFVIDIGNERQNRRQLTTATDAAALDVAQQWANASLSTAIMDGLVGGESDVYVCDSLAQATTQNNNEGLPVDSLECRAEDRGSYGVVTVSVTEAVDYQIASAAGFTSSDTNSSTSVRITASGGGGLRPIALCGVQPDIANWIAGGGTGEPIFDVAQPKFLTAECGNASGNWGLLDLTGNGANSVGTTLTEGYDGAVEISPQPDVCDDKDPESVDGDAINCINTSPGNKWNSKHVKDALDFLDGPDGCAEGGIDFSLPVYSDVQGGSGNNTDFPVIGFAAVQLMCHTIGNGNTGPTNLTLRMLSYDDQGPCCGVSPSNRILEICDVGTVQGDRGPTFGTACADTDPTPPPVGNSCSVSSVSPSDPTPAVTGNNLNSALTVTVQLAAHDDCGTITLFAVNGGSAIPTNSSSGSAATRTFTFNVGSPFGAAGTVRDLDVREDGVSLNSETSVTTDGAAALSCEISFVDPPTQSVNVDGSGSSRQTNGEAMWTITVSGSDSCGPITGAIVRGGNSRALVGSSSPSASMTFTLPDNTPIPNGAHNHQWSVRFFDDGDLLDDSAVVNMT